MGAVFLDDEMTATPSLIYQWCCIILLLYGDEHPTATEEQQTELR